MRTGILSLASEIVEQIALEVSRVTFVLLFSSLIVISLRLLLKTVNSLG